MFQTESDQNGSAMTTNMSAAMPPDALTIADLFINRAGDDRVGVIFEGREWTWDQVVTESAARAALLKEQGLAGMHIGVLLDNTPEYLFLLGAAALSNSVLVGANHTRRGSALAEDIDHTEIAILYTDTTKVDIVENVELPAPVVFVDHSAFLEQVSAQWAKPIPPPEERPKPDDLYLLIFTSGSTGAPKAVRMSHAKMISFGRGSRRLQVLGSAAEGTGMNAPLVPGAPGDPLDPTAMERMAIAFGPDAVFYNAMPMFHTNSLAASVFAGLRSGATIVFKRRFSASMWLSDIRKYGVTNFNYVGRALSYILAQPETPWDCDNKLVMAAGSEATYRDRMEFQRRFGLALPLSEGYTSSEEGINIRGFPGMPEGALGLPYDGQDVVIANPDSLEESPRAVFGPGGELLNSTQAIGEIVRRDSLGSFEGYYANEAANAERTRNGWFWSGDLGYRDQNGLFYFAGRGMDWIRVDSENFAAAPIDRIIARHPDVNAAVAYAVPDPRTGDQVMAALELRKGVAFDPVKFADFLRAQPDLGTKWTPRFVRIVDAIPETANGKVDRKPLRAERWESNDPIWWRSGREFDYELLTHEDMVGIGHEFEMNGRSHLIH